MNGPDSHSTGFLDHAPSADRYENSSVDPDDVAAKLSSMIPRGANVLDVGCGTGSVSQVIRTLTGARLIGIEPDVDRTVTARARGIEVFEGLLSENFLREHGPFDIIVFADVLEHMPDPANAVILAKAGLVPGGAILASVPNVAHWFVRMDLLRGRFDYKDTGIMDATHLRWFTRRTLAEFFQNLGFRVAAIDCTVNIELPDYRQRLPWRWLKKSHRRRLVGVLSKGLPGLFGCQHVIKAVLPS